MQVLLPGCELNSRSHLSIDSNLSHFAEILACILKDQGWQFLFQRRQGLHTAEDAASFTEGPSAALPSLGLQRTWGALSPDHSEILPWKKNVHFPLSSPAKPKGLFSMKCARSTKPRHGVAHLSRSHLRHILGPTKFLFPKDVAAIEQTGNTNGQTVTVSYWEAD